VRIGTGLASGPARASGPPWAVVGWKKVGGAVGPAQRISRLIYCRPRHGRRRREKTEDNGESVAPRRARLSLFAASDTWARRFLGAPRVNSCSFFSLSLHPSRGEGGVVRFGGGRSVWAAAWARDGDHTPLTCAPDLSKRVRMCGSSSGIVCAASVCSCCVE
jgi:hypothetical protein